jgi:peptide chain release factor 1
MQRHVVWSVFDLTILEERDGFVSFLIEGKNASVFNRESGSHVWQRISPTEKRGRTHTSLITVAVLPVPEEREVILKDNDLEISNYCASGNGGQHIQKNQTAVRIVHKPSGIVVTCQNERSQVQNKKFALDSLRAKLKNANDETQQKNITALRKDQIGIGERGGKIRTIRVKDNLVICNVTNSTISFKEYQKGRIRFNNGKE